MFGPPAATDCTNPSGYRRYIRNPIRIAPGEYLAKVCARSWDEAGYEARGRRGSA